MMAYLKRCLPHLLVILGFIIASLAFFKKVRLGNKMSFEKKQERKLFGTTQLLVECLPMR